MRRKTVNTWKAVVRGVLLSLVMAVVVLFLGWLKFLGLIAGCVVWYGVMRLVFWAWDV